MALYAVCKRTTSYLSTPATSPPAALAVALRRCSASCSLWFMACSLSQRVTICTLPLPAAAGTPGMAKALRRCSQSQSVCPPNSLSVHGLRPCFSTYVLSICREILPSYDRYWGRGRNSALMVPELRNASALEFFESPPTRRKTQSRHSDGERAVNSST